MRPSEKPGVIAVLDSLAECKVVNDAFDDPAFAQKPNPQQTAKEAYEEMRSSMRHRFHTQAMHLPLGDAYATECNFVADPEFDIVRDYGDAYFVLSAAERIVSQKSLPDKAFNLLTGRTKAAKNIIKFLTSRED